jgi:hypothetical protein
MDPEELEISCLRRYQETLHWERLLYFHFQQCRRQESYLKKWTLFYGAPRVVSEPVDSEH